jgi:hypothetical protein
MQPTMPLNPPLFPRRCNGLVLKFFEIIELGLRLRL